jgi:hypothetical protein
MTEEERAAAFRAQLAARAASRTARLAALAGSTTARAALQAAWAPVISDAPTRPVQGAGRRRIRGALTRRP